MDTHMSGRHAQTACLSGIVDDAEKENLDRREQGMSLGLAGFLALLFLVGFLMEVGKP